MLPYALMTAAGFAGPTVRLECSLYVSSSKGAAPKLPAGLLAAHSLAVSVSRNLGDRKDVVVLA